jgi:hypothetical protein
MLATYQFAILGLHAQQFPDLQEEFAQFHSVRLATALCEP